MHQKKSEVQIGKESSGISSDFNPYSIHQYPSLTPSPLFPPQTQSTTTYKRPLLTQATPSSSSTLAKSPTLYQLTTPTPHFPSTATNSRNNNNRIQLLANRIQLPAIRGLRLHVINVVFLSFFLFYLIIICCPTHSVLLLVEFLSAFAFAGALIFSFQLALPRLPSIRLFLSRAISVNLNPSGLRRRPLPVFWTVGGKKQGSGGATGFRVQVYSNGDVYEGEFRKGKCWGSGVYYYSMSGRYEGDWVDGKYEGFGVETWARGSRYKGQFRMGLRHGFGVYRFYTGDVYAGEWSSGQSHGCGVHTCDDGSKYVGEFKWGVKHGLGHYHFR